MKVARKKKLIVFYDGWCPFCLRTKNILRKIDWLKRLDYESIRDPFVLEKYHLDAENVVKRMHTIRFEDDKMGNGIYSILSIAKLIPSLWIFVPALYLSIHFGFGEKIYDWLASKRKVLPVGGCAEDVCEVPKR